MIDLEQTAKDLKEHGLVDRGILKPGGKKEVSDTMQKIRSKGLNAFVLLLPCGDPIEPWKPLWDSLKPDTSKDLLLIFNCNQWVARGWNLNSAKISEILNSAEPELRVYYGRGLATALQRLAVESSPAQNVDSEEGFSWFVPTAGGLVAIGAVGAIALVIRKRMRRAAEVNQTYQEALSSAKKTQADVILAAEELPEGDPDAQDLKVKALDLAEQIEWIVVECRQKPELKGKAMTLGKLQQAENELRVLMTTILQKLQSSKGGDRHVERNY